MGPERFITLCIAVPPIKLPTSLPEQASPRRLGGSYHRRSLPRSGQGLQVAYTFAQRHVICERAPLAPLLEHHNRSFRGIREHRGGRLLGHTTLAIQLASRASRPPTRISTRLPKTDITATGLPPYLRCFVGSLEISEVLAPIMPSITPDTASSQQGGAAAGGASKNPHHQHSAASGTA